MCVARGYEETHNKLMKRARGYSELPLLINFAVLCPVKMAATLLTTLQINDASLLHSIDLHCSGPVRIIGSHHAMCVFSFKIFLFWLTENSDTMKRTHLRRKLHYWLWNIMLLLLNFLVDTYEFSCRLMIWNFAVYIRQLCGHHPVRSLKQSSSRNRDATAHTLIYKQNGSLQYFWHDCDCNRVLKLNQFIYLDAYERAESHRKLTGQRICAATTNLLKFGRETWNYKAVAAQNYL